MAGTRLSIGPVRIKRIEPALPEQPSDSPIFFPGSDVAIRELISLSTYRHASRPFV
jgi:hypothetical protein